MSRRGLGRGGRWSLLRQCRRRRSGRRAEVSREGWGVLRAQLRRLGGVSCIWLSRVAIELLLELELLLLFLMLELLSMLELLLSMLELELLLLLLELLRVGGVERLAVDERH